MSPAACSRPGSRWVRRWPASPPQRGGPALAASLTETLDALAATDDDVERQQHALTFWDQIVDAADSVVFRLMFNSLRAAYEPALEALAPLMAAEVGQIGAYRVLAAALGENDPETARAAAERVLRPATQTLLAALEQAEGTDEEDAAMTKATPEVEALAAQRLAADESRITGQQARRTSLPLGGAWRAFWSAPSPWLIGGFLVGAVVGADRGRRRQLVGARDPRRPGRGASR